MIDVYEKLLLLVSGLFFLYAETHFRILGLFSRYFKKEPEIVADVPVRLDPGRHLPVLLLIKDAHRFPIVLFSVLVQVNKNGKPFLEKEFTYREKVDQKWWWELKSVELPKATSGEIQVSIRFDYEIRGEEKSAVVDNYALSSKAPFIVSVDPDPLPQSPNCYFGDMHVHTALTDDQVEFGAPIEATLRLAGTMGLSFFATTDHSYDLDDSEESYLQNDPALPKWRRLWREVEQLNSQQDSFVIIPGEELSAGNSKNRNVHFLILNNRDFIPGNGDSAEKWLQNKPDLSIAEAVKLVDDDALCFAAHPENKTALLQWLLIRRGKWEDADYRVIGLTGLQIWNGETNRTFYAGINKWVQLLLEGYRPVLIGGNDAHGNFGRFRQINIPHLFISEKETELFGQVRTGVFLAEKLNLGNLLRAIKQGRCFVTDGPFASLEIRGHNSTASIGEVYPEKQGVLKVEVKSSRCFGEIKTVQFIVGDIVLKKETQSCFFQITPGCFEYSTEKFLADLPKRGYLRLQVKTSRKRQCLTNPVFLEH